jgi:hypothetical protein
MATQSIADERAQGKPEVVPAPRRQIALRGLFICTGYFAVSSALALRFGLGIFVLMNGLFLTWLSFRGYLWWAQSNRARPRVYGIGWLLFAVSFGLPAFTVNGCGNGAPTTYYGWEAAVSTAQMSLEAVSEADTLIRQPEHRTRKGFRQLLQAVLLVLLWNLPNVLMLASPYMLFRQQRGRGQLMTMLFCCAAVSTWTWGISVGEELRIGYYVWSCGITIISLARATVLRSMTAMAVTGLLWLLMAVFLK